MHPIKAPQQQQEFFNVKDVSPRQLAVKKDKSKEQPRPVNNARSGGTGAMITQPQVTELQSE